MKKSSGCPATVARVSPPVRQYGQCVALAAGVVVVLLSLASPAQAKVVYTRMNVTLSGNGSILFDLDRDGTTDFTLRSVSRVTACGLRGGVTGSTKITPKKGDGVVVSRSNVADVLAAGALIDGGAMFVNATAIVTQFYICSTAGAKHVEGYLGLEFQINGQTHFGWARVTIDATFAPPQNHGMTTKLFGFAYETIPGQAIKAGQRSGTANDDSLETPDSPSPEDSGTGTF